MSDFTNAVSVSIMAGPIQLADRPPHPEVGQMVLMGVTGFYFHITKDVAAQWLPVIQSIAGDK